MQLIIKKLLIIMTIIITFESNHSKVFTSVDDFDDYGLISIMYHRFDESKYPSTNIQLDVFKEQLQIIEDLGIRFIHPNDFKKSLSREKKERKILLTIDDGLLSFYENAWPILNKKYTIYFICKHKRGWCLQLYELGSNLRAS